MDGHSVGSSSSKPQKDRFGFEIDPEVGPHAPSDFPGESNEFVAAALPTVDEGEGVIGREPDPAAGRTPRESGVFDEPGRRELVPVLPHLMSRRQLDQTRAHR